jgi:FG-GAP repeat protein
MNGRRIPSYAAIAAAALLAACGGGSTAPERRWVGVKLTASDGAAGDSFGEAVAASADGSVVVVGAVVASGTRGAAYVFRRSGSSWAEAKLAAADGAAGDFFGNDVSVSSDGNTIAVGTLRSEPGRGAAYVFTRNGAGWIETRLAESDVVQPATSSGFGASVSLSADGGALAVGSSQGDTYVLARSGTTWTGTKVNAGKQPGATSLSSDADTVAQGWPTQKAVGVYRAGAWTETLVTASDALADDMFGFSVSTFSGGDGVAVGAYDARAASTPGAVYVYRWNGAAWAEERLVSSDGVPGDEYGFSVAASADGGVLAVGAREANRAYVHRRSGAAWTEEKLTPTDGALGVSFGVSVAVAAGGDTVAVGAPRDASYRGAAYVYVHE